MRPEPQRLYGPSEIATMLGLSRHAIVKQVEYTGSPDPEYVIMRGGAPTMLWSHAALDQWRAFLAGEGSIPRRDRYSGYSDHVAVNQLGPMTVTWKLWWSCTFDGGTRWWFSTPSGWWTSDNDGRDWNPHEGGMLRPTDNRYYSVMGNVRPRGALVGVLREVEKLRRWIDSSATA